MLWSVLSRFFFWSPVASVFFPGLYGLFQVYLLQLVSPSPSYSTTFSALWQDPRTCLSFRFLSFSLCGSLGQQNPLDGNFLSCWLTVDLVLWPGFGDPFICPTEFYESNFLGQILVRAYTICQHDLLYNSQWITFPTQSCLFSYSFFATLLHSLIMWLTISSVTSLLLSLLSFAIECVECILIFANLLFFHVRICQPTILSCILYHNNDSIILFILLLSIWCPYLYYSSVPYISDVILMNIFISLIFYSDNFKVLFETGPQNC